MTATNINTTIKQLISRFTTQYLDRIELSTNYYSKLDILNETDFIDRMVAFTGEGYSDEEEALINADSDIIEEWAQGDYGNQDAWEESLYQDFKYTPERGHEGAWLQRVRQELF